MLKLISSAGTILNDLTFSKFISLPVKVIISTVLSSVFGYISVLFPLV